MESTHSPRPRRIRAALTALLAAFAVLATACNPTSTPMSRSVAVWGNHPCQVGVIGDSLTVGARDFGALGAKFAQAGCQVTAIDARTGRPTREGADIAEAWARNGTMPRILVVALGTNDCSRAAYTPQVARILAAAGPDRPVVWVNTWRAGCDRQINATLTDTQKIVLGNRADKGNLWILNHHGWVAANRGVLRPDGVHLNRDAYAAHAGRIVTMVTTGAGG
jgi:lysophospholipase L1-like esterase